MKEFGIRNMTWLKNPMPGGPRTCVCRNQQEDGSMLNINKRIRLLKNRAIFKNVHFNNQIGVRFMSNNIPQPENQEAINPSGSDELTKEEM